MAGESADYIPAVGGPIVPNLEHAGRSLEKAAVGIFGTVERWAKSGWARIKDAWNVSKEHLAHWFPVGGHFVWTAPWIGLTSGVGLVGVLGAAELFRRHRKKKRATQEQAAK